MGTGISRDKGLLEEGREAGWFRDSIRSFSEPGVQPHYGPDAEFVLQALSLSLTLDPAAGSFEAVADVSVGPTPTGLGIVCLDLDEVTVLQVVNSAGDDVDWRHEEGKLNVVGLNAATTLTITYQGQPRRGLYFVGPDAAAPDRSPQVWSQCQDEDGHFFFPCIDHPRHRQPVDISVTAPADYTVVCNGVLKETVAQENGWVRWVWSEPTAIPAYLVTVVVARLDIHEDGAHQDGAGDLPVRYLVPEGTPPEDLPRIFGRTPEMIAFYAKRFGHLFPWPRYDQVVVEEFIFGGMENAGATTLTDLTLVDERVQPEWDPELLIAHELAHQWFGDLVTCRDWSQAWLNEGWATYSESLWIEQRDGPHMAAWYTWNTARGYLEEADGRYARPIVTYLFREPIDLFDRHLYHKAGCVLHTLRHELGDTCFWPGVHRYLARHGHEAVVTRDFQRALEEATGRTLDGFFQQWIHSPGHPELTVKLSWAKDQLSVAVSQTQTGEGVPSAFHFTLRLGILDAETGEERVVDLAVKEREQTFVLASASPRAVRVDPGFRVLARLKLEAPLEWRVALLEADECPVVRIRAATSLGKSAEPAALEALCAALSRDSAWAVRVELARLLGKDRGEVARNALLGALDVESDLRVRTAIVRALGTLRHPDVDTALHRVAMEGDPSLFAEGAAAECLGKLRSPKAVEACQALLERDSWGDVLQSRALSGLGACRDPAWLDLLVTHASMGHSQRVRSAAIGALANLGEAVPSCLDFAVEFLCESATDGPFRVVLAAVAGLGRLKDPKALGVLDRLHASAADGRVRRMAWEAARDIREGRGTSDALRSLRDDFDAAGGRAADLRDRVASLEHRFET